MTDTTELRTRIENLEKVADLDGKGANLNTMIDNLQTAIDKNNEAIDILTAAIIMLEPSPDIIEAIHKVRDGYGFRNLRQ